MWNLIGIGAWVVLIAYLIFVMMNIRSRHLKMVVMRQKPARTLMIDALELVVLAAAAYGMAWVTWLRPVDFTDTSSIAVHYQYDKLIIQPDASSSYYVTVQSGNGKVPVRHFTYWTAGAKTEITSQNADLSTGTNPLTIRASAYPWQTKRLAELDRTAEKAWVASLTSTYKPTFLNGLGMHVGHSAERFDLIRVPNDTVIKVLPLDRN
ncbi:LVIS_2131 family protein [Lacticaseibacillus daqingensis]|uniref:LVIS_2131 family protein n=1 Tax=Lacticaseibacillus daqingensis TaxID=2486014 RepID=UPI000F7923C2|nr:LVIS_2131 family protein [Lacticaseibacillus daqingensis]